MRFVIDSFENGVRQGRVFTDHGIFETPAFMPVGTQGSVKATKPDELSRLGAQIILSNTYHLYLRPGTDILERAGGLHKFMGWNRPILTDSGGYQVFSLSELRRLSEEGVHFRSHIDGSSHLFTPESVIDIERVIGSDIMMVLDECTPYPCDHQYAAKSNDLTIRWAIRSFSQYRNTEGRYGHTQALFGIVQGSIYPEIRRQSAMSLMEIPFDGYAIGGLAVGEPAQQMYDIVSICTEILPVEKPRYLMGVGTPENLLEAISRGVDMFDCVLPTRNGRNAMMFTRNGPVNITNAQYKADFQPVEEGCECDTCRNFSRAYIRHLFISHEILALQLATIHNLFFYQWLMREARMAIREHRFDSWKREQFASFHREQIQLS
jgi:queuine tRNA-ribosyltransferase